METSRRAAEIAKKLFIDCGNCPEFHQDNCSCFGKLAKALDEYAREAVASQKSRIERLEGALRKIASNEFGRDCHGEPIGCQECGADQIAKESLSDGEAK